jgi:DNA-directed RNA polymerase specialized sigma24 family protein
VSTAALPELSRDGHGDHGGRSGNSNCDLGEAVSTRQSLMAALATLPPRQRAVVVLRFFHDYTEAATAEAMGTSVGTVKSQTFKALASLRIFEELREGAAPDIAGSAREGMTR